MNKIQKLEKELEKEKAKTLQVMFLSPGTLFDESTSKPIKTKSVKTAVTLAKKITERHSAKPYGFYFCDGNGKAQGGIYYLTGKLFRYIDIPETSENHILRSNMKINDYPIVIENYNSWKHTSPFKKEDFIVDWSGKVFRSGTDEDLIKYRAIFKKELRKGE